uniref:Phosphotransferase n=1 Tax=Anisakis simplex TaxID=6269 RepID=A0A1L5SN06_ANISI|nr:hexokinase 1 [Anisakis simplex]
MLGVISLASSIGQWLETTPQRRPALFARQKTVQDIYEDIDKMTGKGTQMAQEEVISLESVMAEFKLPNSTLRRMMEHMSKNMDRGLKGGLAMSTISMLPSFVPELPDGTEEGTFIAMDLGGTNLRVMLMKITPGEPLTAEQFNTRIPNWAMHGTGEQLFDFIANCLADFLIEKGIDQAGLPLGFTFSYPCDQTGLRSARLLRWTKGFEATGVVGEDVVQLLEKAIAKNGKIKVEVVALINDTVGTMVAAAHEAGGVCHVGAIIATGTNASYMEDCSKITQGLSTATEPYPYPQMIIDTEWGGFGDRNEAEYILTQYDKLIDSRSEHPGVNVFDKLVAGRCMGELVRMVLEKLTRSGVLFGGRGSEPLFTRDQFPTKYISEILSDEGGSYQNTRQIMGELGIEQYTFSDMLLFREVCIVVSRRSANLGAAAIACLLNRIRKPDMIVGIDGSTYKYHPFFDFWVNEKLRELVDPSIKFRVIQTGDGSGKGAALITAIVSRLKRRKQLEEARTTNQTQNVSVKSESEECFNDDKFENNDEIRLNEIGIEQVVEQPSS